MTNSQLIQLYETLIRITTNTDLRFSVKIGYYLAKNKAAIREDALLLYNARSDLMREYGKIQDNGDIIVEQSQFSELQKKIDEILNIETNVQIFPIDVDELKEYQLNIEDIEGLMPILYEPLKTGPAIYEENTGE